MFKIHISFGYVFEKIVNENGSSFPIYSISYAMQDHKILEEPFPVKNTTDFNKLIEKIGLMNIEKK